MQLYASTVATLATLDRPMMMMWYDYDKWDRLSF